MQASGDFTGARTMYERALKIWEVNLGIEHPQVARALNNLGMLMQDLGDLVGARMMLERALKIKRKTYPPDHPSIKLTQENLDSLNES
jgi:tetratricopeptide (TPR) repeat protein